MGVRMSFGKYAGQELTDIPRSYLQWLDRLPDLQAWLRAAVKTELADRSRSAERPTVGTTGRRGDLAAVAPVVTSWYREMALRFHPDRGGSHEAMQAINHAHDRLRELLAG